jgi:hypothetical protein
VKRAVNVSIGIITKTTDHDPRNVRRVGDGPVVWGINCTITPTATVHGTTVGRTHSWEQWIGAHAQPLHEVRQACVCRWPGCGLAVAGPLAVRVRVADNRGHGREIPAPCRAVTTYRRVCGLCGRAFWIYIPPGDQETERDKLCADCAKLPSPPKPDAR